jgi:predicted  nucleic acid-binding Zn-ribbon protein
MDDIRDTRPWFWILVAALAAVAVVALVIAISANNESVDQKQVVAEATAQVKEEVSGLDTAVAAANEFQAESDQLAAQDRKRIKREVNAAVAGGEKELLKLKKRVSSLESEIHVVTEAQEKLTKSNSKLSAELRETNSNLTIGLEDVEAEIAELDQQVTKLQKRVG